MLKYLIAFFIILLIFVLFSEAPEPGYERLHYAFLLAASLMSLTPLALFTLLKESLEDKDA